MHGGLVMYNYSNHSYCKAEMDIEFVGYAQKN